MLALREDGTLWAWGNNYSGQLGNGTFTTNFPYGLSTPQPLQPTRTWQAVAAGGGHTVALRADGTLWTWGANYFGQMGDGTFTTTNTPQRIQTSMAWKDVTAASSHTVALREDGTLWTWGWNSYGQLGNGTFSNANAPEPIQTNMTWKAVSAGGSHTLAIRADGTLWSWGDNTYGQLGITVEVTPVRLTTASDWGSPP